MTRFLILIALASMAVSCQLNDQEETETETILCEVYNKKLLYSDVKDLIPSAADRQDSILFLRSYVNRWIKDELFLREAEIDRGQDEKLQEMIQNYRESLIKLHYEQQLFKNISDSIDVHDLKDYYQENIKNYILQNTLAKIALFKPEKKNAQSRRQWNEALQNDLKKLNQYTDSEEAYAFIDTTIWLRESEIKDLLPSEINKTDWLQEGEIPLTGVYLYAYKVLEKGDYAPIEYITEEVKRDLIQDKRKELIESKRNELYENELNKKNVNNYVQ